MLFKEERKGKKAKTLYTRCRENVIEIGNPLCCVAMRGELLKLLPRHSPPHSRLLHPPDHFLSGDIDVGVIVFEVSLYSIHFVYR